MDIHRRNNCVSGRLVCWSPIRESHLFSPEGKPQMTSKIPFVNILQWNAAFGPSGCASERAAIMIEDLASSLDDLSRSADTAELLLKKDCPGEAASLGAKVSAAINLLRVVRCQTCRGWGRIDQLDGDSRPCTDCRPSPSVSRPQEKTP